ncbi:MAG: DUF3108 domain-containing protein [Candidatus Cardinium sp.]|uniref:DUF3108 domain-containing protein n=1 Tax=Cardinium endosymbiont of Dermatophagoides farinae TaxID=2597823 RepID=UPI0011830AB8|nr:DUF3108 domain-containing protein [Cardinium endosymbiont of Dermatophagoides farinae]TSJ81088.1 DUF3108 domain-containing protein [Cardinium endosymbiont of Dermatophagoides farinae]UWW97127.1 MAG: DUF3108 domain-containing protein [Candidatus Cardinium sp.]
MVVVRCLKKFFCCFLISTFLSSIHAKTAREVGPPFLQGECLTYEVYYSFLHASFLHAGTATMRVDEERHKLNGHACYKVEVQGTSSNALALLGFKVLDRWESYLDVDCAHALRPHRCVTHLEENGYVRKEQTDFDYKENIAKVEIAESKNNMEPKETSHDIPSTKIKDLIGGYYSLRSIDTTKLKPDDELIITVFHDQQVYKDVKIRFLGKKIINTKLGKTSALVFAPMIPDKYECSIFSGDRPVEVYISNDVNKIPLLLKVNLVVGSLEIKLTDCKGLKEPIRFQPS